MDIKTNRHRNVYYCVKSKKYGRWWSRSTGAHHLSWKQQNYNQLLKNCQQNILETIKKKWYPIPKDKEEATSRQ